MTVLHTIGKCQIISEREDDCLPNWTWICVISGIIIMFCSFVAMIVFIVNGSPVNAWAIGAIILCAGFGMIYTPHLKKGCGVEISLKMNNQNSFEEDRHTSYQFTKDIEQDEIEIFHIIDGYMIVARQSFNAKDLEDERRKACCIKYNNVMERVMK